MTVEQQDAVKAKNKKTRLKCEFCDKLGHTESECGMLKSTIADLKKENAKKSVACTTSTPAEGKEKKRGDRNRFQNLRFLNSSKCFFGNLLFDF